MFAGVWSEDEMRYTAWSGQMNNVSRSDPDLVLIRERKIAYNCTRKQMHKANITAIEQAAPRCR